MNLSDQIEAVYRRALLLKQYALESPAQEPLLEKALQELYFVLEELQTAQDEQSQQQQALIGAQQTVALERQRYQSLFDLAPNGYLVTDRQGNIYQANHHAAAFLFYCSQEFLTHKPLLVFIYQPDRSRFQTQLANLAPGHRWEIRLNPREGVLITVGIAVTRMKDPQSQADRLLWSLHDITQHKRIEARLQTAYHDLEQRVEKHQGYATLPSNA
jgi:PAS domain S-box-containing protein